MVMMTSLVFSQAVNTTITAETGVFTVSFDITPSQDDMDGAVGFSSGEVSAWSDMSAIIGFENNNLMRTYDSTGYVKMVIIPWQGNVAYHIVMTVDVPNETYSAVLVDGSDSITIAYNYRFRANGVASIDNFFSMNNTNGGGGSTATFDVTNYTAIAASSQPTYAIVNGVFTSFAIPQPSGNIICEYDVTPSLSIVDCSVALSENAVLDWGNMSPIVRFDKVDPYNIDVRNGSSYESLIDYPYIGGSSYHITEIIDIDAQTYDVYVTYEDSTTKLADDYAFRFATSTLNYRAIAMNNLGSIEVLNFNIYDNVDLSAAITAAQASVDAGVIGTLNGQYTQAVKDAAQAAIDAAQAVADVYTADDLTGIVALNEAATDLATAMELYVPVTYDFTTLDAAIATAKTDVAAATVGTAEGEYLQTVLMTQILPLQRLKTP
jgi:hypothetical protein